MRAVFISDTHGQHTDLELPPGDILLHTGDVSKVGTQEEVVHFLTWFAALDYPYKVFIAGNHDFFFEREEEEAITNLIPDGVIYLNDSGVEIEGHYIWGSPIQPTFFDWAFNRDRGEAIQKHWDLIPEHTDILLTHGPPYGMLDKTVRGQLVGCENLITTIRKIQPRIHAFGHIHEAYGVLEQSGCTFINASVLDIRYRLSHAPVIVEL